MANSKYEYVRAFERDEILLPNTWIVVRIDGRGFHKLSDHYSFSKPNDTRALSLMNAAAVQVFTMIVDLVFGYGVSDEFSFVFQKDTGLFERRTNKLVSTIVSTFTAYYVHLWPRFFSDVALDPRYLPTFDGRAICYPSLGNLSDYLSWRQVDCHINNLYNTTFWALVQKDGISTTDAENLLKGTVASNKNEILFSRFGINYNNENPMFRKGSIVFRDYDVDELASETGVKSKEQSKDRASRSEVHEPVSKTQAEKMRKAKAKAKVVIQHVDIISNDFWDKRPWILSEKPGKPTG